MSRNREEKKGIVKLWENVEQVRNEVFHLNEMESTDYRGYKRRDLDIAFDNFKLADILKLIKTKDADSFTKELVITPNNRSDLAFTTDVRKPEENSEDILIEYFAGDEYSRSAVNCTGHENHEDLYRIFNNGELIDIIEQPLKFLNFMSKYQNVESSTYMWEPQYEFIELEDHSNITESFIMTTRDFSMDDGSVLKEAVIKKDTMDKYNAIVKETKVIESDYDFIENISIVIDSINNEVFGFIYPNYPEGPNEALCLFTLIEDLQFSIKKYKEIIDNYENTNTEDEER